MTIDVWVLFVALLIAIWIVSIRVCFILVSHDRIGAGLSLGIGGTLVLTALFAVSERIPFKDAEVAWEIASAVSVIVSPIIWGAGMLIAIWLLDEDSDGRTA